MFLSFPVIFLDILSFRLLKIFSPLFPPCSSFSLFIVFHFLHISHPSIIFPTFPGSKETHSLPPYLHCKPSPPSLSKFRYIYSRFPLQFSYLISRVLSPLPILISYFILPLYLSVFSVLPRRSVYF